MKIGQICKLNLRANIDVSNTKDDYWYWLKVQYEWLSLKYKTYVVLCLDGIQCEMWWWYDVGLVR